MSARKPRVSDAMLASFTRRMLPDMSFTMNGLGRVPYRSNRSGGFTGVVPVEIELWAEARGLVCQCALHETNQYLMGITTKHLEWSNSLPEVKP